MQDFLYAALLIPILLCGCTNQPPPPKAATENDVPSVEPPPDKFAFISTHGNVHCAWIDRAFINNAAALKGAATAIDPKDERYCEVLFWTDKKLVPEHEWPMSDRQSDALSVTYFRNPKTGDCGLTWSDGRELKWRLH